MTDSPVSLRTETALNTMSPLLRFFSESRWAHRFGAPGVCDFTIGNPHEMPLPGVVEALRHWSVPRDCYWYAYKMNEEAARNTVVASLRKWRDILFEPEDIFLTNGATAAIVVVLHTIVDPGDEVIFITPSWFLYEAISINTGAVPVRVKALPPAFDLDLTDIEQAITAKTRAVIINSPNNPTGRIYSAETLKGLAQILTRSSRKNGRMIYLISDEAYSRIVFDGNRCPSPTAFYDSTFLVYTYGKTLLTPGQRIGYIALPPAMPERPLLREALLSQQMLNSWAFPNALLQHALGDLEQVSVDLERLQRKRDRVVRALSEMGYTVPTPEGTFYCLVRSPLADDRVFVEMLAEHDVFCMPGTLQEANGYFRLSLTATEEMIERALPVFAQSMAQVRGEV